MSMTVNPATQAGGKRIVDLVGLEQAERLHVGSGHGRLRMRLIVGDRRYINVKMIASGYTADGPVWVVTRRRDGQNKGKNGNGGHEEEP